MYVRVVKIKVLGEGCFGVVHLVKTIAPVYNKVYAMKSVDEDHSSSLRKEEEILQLFVDSPNVVRCHGGFTSVERERGVVYNMFMEYASEGSLLNLMRKNGGRIPERDVNCYTRMILEGLFDIHRKGFVHCDLKPGNILVFPPRDGRGLASLKIADFGLAKQVGIAMGHLRCKRSNVEAFQWRIAKHPGGHVDFRQGFLKQVFCYRSKPKVECEYATETPVSSPRACAPCKGCSPILQ
ncbi:hypothetical protein V6N13_069261 [Hibiscus sabdariffa]|uniref:Uncharacterized protein n=2 Tax=Hibiscus sabdariffa TaxID=183260 RepID=A0ABR2PFQ9_9ROSI